VIGHRTSARGVLLLLIAGLASVLVATAGAGKSVTKIVFPVVGQTQYTDDFGDPRPGGRHEGNDIMAPRKAIAVAAEAGTVKFWTTSAQAGCMLYLYGASGTTYLYIHLNNDLGKGNDNKGKCVAGTAYAPGLKSGAKVAAGQRIGFVGDSGDANGIHPHLHFEVHPGGNGAVDPYPYLQAATHLLFSVPKGSVYTLSLAGTVLAVTDESLKIQVAAAKEWTTGRIEKKVNRPVVVTVPFYADVRSATTKTQPTRKLQISDVAKGQHLVVWTQPTVTSPAAERGDDGVITAAVVVLYPKS